MNTGKTGGIKSGSYCWRSIGIWSKGVSSCPKLKEMLHCRNCSEFTLQGRALFDIKASDDYLHEWQEFLSEERHEVLKSLESVLIFRLGHEWFAFRTAALKEIVEPCKIHRIPNKTEEALMGLANIKGELHLCFSLHKLLGIELRDENISSKQKFMILEKDGFSWVFPADEISGINKYNMEDVGNIPVTVSKSDANYIKEIFHFDHRNTAYLDDELILYSLKRRIS